MSCPATKYLFRSVLHRYSALPPLNSFVSCNGPLGPFSAFLGLLFTHFPSWPNLLFYDGRLLGLHTVWAARYRAPEDMYQCYRRETSQMTVVLRPYIHCPKLNDAMLLCCLLTWHLSLYSLQYLFLYYQSPSWFFSVLLKMFVCTLIIQPICTSGSPNPYMRLIR
jgi:hypothetical protein